MMTVGELIKLLQEFDERDIVVMSSDAEGNNYSPLNEAVYGIYVPTTTWYGEVYEAGDEAEVAEDDTQHLACILYPVN